MTEQPSQQHIEATVNGAVEQLRRVMSTGRFSPGLALDIALLTLVDRLDVSRVIEEIAIMEGTRSWQSTTKPATPFTHRLLRGFWHKHYTQAGHMARDIQIEMHRDGTIERVLSKYMGQVMTKVILDELVHALVKEN